MAAPLPQLVLTGATGFVGRRLVEALREQHAANPAESRDVTLLLRDPSAISRASLPPHWNVVATDLSSGELPAGVIAPGSVVVHLAAATGKLSPAVMRAVNVEGTRRLVAASVAAGAAHFVFVSSIAASFADRRWYHYAQAKLDAESTVAQSALAYTIVRPAMVFGRGSPVQEGLERLALGGAPIVLGNGLVEVQPIHVDDLARVLLALSREVPSISEVLEVGGARRMSMRTLLDQIRQAHGLPSRTPWSVPLALPRWLLAQAERVVGARLPVTAGQLASFVNDSSARPSPRVEALLPYWHTLGDMLDPLDATAPAVAERSKAASHDATPSPSALDDPALAREFATFAAYLGARDLDSRVAASYLRAHASVGDGGDAFDLWLLALARSSTAGCALADAYARLVRPYGVLRRKLVLALAVLESSPVVHERFDRANPSSPLVAWGGLVVAGIAWGARTALAVLLLAPLQLAARFPRDGKASPAHHG